MAFDSQGRMFVSADYSGEIYVIVRDEANNGTSGGSSNTSNGSAAGGGKTSGAKRSIVSSGVLGLVIVAIVSAV